MASMGVFTLLQSIWLALLQYPQREGPVLKYYTFSAKETKQVKGAQSNLSQANLAWSAICSAKSDYTSENRREERTIPEKFLLGTSLCPKVGNNSKKAAIKYDAGHFVMSLAFGTQNPSNWNLPNAFHEKSSKFYARQYFPLCGNIGGHKIDISAWPTLKECFGTTVVNTHIKECLQPHVSWYLFLYIHT